MRFVRCTFWREKLIEKLFLNEIFVSVTTYLEFALELDLELD